MLDIENTYDIEDIGKNYATRKYYQRSHLNKKPSVL